MTPRLVHVYGGGFVAVFGISLVYLPAGIAVGGAFLVWLGLTWVRDA